MNAMNQSSDSVQLGKTSAQIALNWIISKGAIQIPSAKNARQAQDNGRNELAIERGPDADLGSNQSGIGSKKSDARFSVTLMD